MKHARTIILLVVWSLCYSELFAHEVIPQPGSPLARRVHPRLHITPDTIPVVREMLSTPQYRDKYQEYVNGTAAGNDNDKSNILPGANEFAYLEPLMIQQAYIAAIGTVPGIVYPIPIEQFARRAIDRYLQRLRTTTEPLAHAGALVYDWTYAFMTDAERSEIATAIVTRVLIKRGPTAIYTLENPEGSPTNLFSSGYYDSMFAWYVGLAFWGDGLIDETAAKAVNSFHEVMLNNGHLDGQNFVSGNDGGWSEWIGYARHHPRMHMVLMDGWRTATGENYIADSTATGNAIRSYASFLHYAVDSHKYYDKYFSFIKVGDSGPVATGDAGDQGIREQMAFLPGLLQNSGLTTEAGLARHFVTSYEVPWPKYLTSYNFGFFGISPTITPVTPEGANLPKSRWCRNMGAFYARTGFNSRADTVFHVVDSQFQYTGHTGAWGVPSFGLAKFGELMGLRDGGTKDTDNLSDYPGGVRENALVFEGLKPKTPTKIEGSKHLTDALAGKGTYNLGGIEQVTAKDGVFYQVRTDRSRMWSAGMHHSREYVWIPGQNSTTDSDFLIVYDRSTSSSNKPRWIYHVPWKPDVEGYLSTVDLATGTGEADRIGTAYIGASNVVVKEFNSRMENSTEGDEKTHGAVFCKTLLPSQVRVETTRVAKLKNNVETANMKSKQHNWQVEVTPVGTASEQRFLHVYETADANLKTNMVVTTTILAGNMQGAWIEKERADRKNYAVLFNQAPGVNTNTVIYSINGNGTTRHVITGIAAGFYRILEDGSSLLTKSTETDVSLWDYRGTATNIMTGTLCFDTTASGAHTYTITVDEGTPGDSDGDGLPDDWEITHFGSISDSRANPSVDADGDGFDNESEWKSGTIPVNSASRLAMVDETIAPPSGFQFAWQSVINQSYEIQSSPDLVIWTTIGSVTAVSTNTVWTDAGISSESKKFYRVRVP
jgi:hypothetical protein